MKKIDSIKKKIRYRAEYRGFKEMVLLLSKFVKKYINTFNYNELLDLYEILEKDDDILFKWYSANSFSEVISESKVSKLLKNFKID